MSIRARFKGPALALATGALSACTLAPHYERPEAPVSAAYESAADTAAARPAADVAWSEFFPDPELQALIARALENNRDLRIATLNVEAARAQYQIQRAELLPSIDAVGTADNEQVPASISPSGRAELTRTYSAGFASTAFELDLFGRVRSLKDAALERYFALEENRTAAQLALVSEVATTWLTLLADQDLLRLAEETRGSQHTSYELTQLRFQQGVSSEIELRRSESSWREAEVDIAQQKRRVVLDRNALALLVGEPLPAETGAGTHTIDAQTFGETLPAGIPSELLTRRPDILAAEHALKASNADIGAARAAFLPSIELTGFYGNASDDLSALFQSGNERWSFVPQIRLPIFHAGANKAALDLATVRKDIGIARYEQAIQTAFREVSDALIARSTLEEQLRAQDALTRAAEASYGLADMRYRSGVDSYLGSLIAQRDLYDAERALIVTRLASTVNLVQLYRALGGGWQ